MYDPSVFSLVMWIFIPSGTIGAISSSALFDTDYTVYPAKPQEGKLQGVPQAAVQPLFSPLHRAGDGGAVHPQLLSNLGHFQSPVVIEEHHLPLPGRQLLLPGPAQAAPQPLQLGFLRLSQYVGRIAERGESHRSTD